MTIFLGKRSEFYSQNYLLVKISVSKHSENSYLKTLNETHCKVCSLTRQWCCVECTSCKIRQIWVLTGNLLDVSSGKLFYFLETLFLDMWNGYSCKLAWRHLAHHRWKICSLLTLPPPFHTGAFYSVIFFYTVPRQGTFFDWWNN